MKVGIGSDGEKENNNLDLVEEMKVASLLQKVTTLDPTSGDPWDVIRQATVEGAAALGLDDVTGSLEPGKRADVVTVALDGLHTTPIMHGDLFNVAAHIVFSASGRDVRDVWVDGRRVVRGRRPADVRRRARARRGAGRGRGAVRAARQGARTGVKWLLRGCDAGRDVRRRRNRARRR